MSFLDNSAPATYVQKAKLYAFGERSIFKDWGQILLFMVGEVHWIT